MKIAIHQPNFMPWLPFFKKMESVDAFILLTNCQYEKNGFQNRFNRNNVWHTMSVKSGMLPICEKQYARPSEDWEKIKKSLPEFNLKIFDHKISESLSSTNCGLICFIAALLGITTPIFLDFPTELKSSDRLVEICQRFGADCYLAGSSGAGYMDLEKFKSAGISIENQVIREEDKLPIVEVLKSRGAI